jgi:hypothetical protein
MMKKEYRVLDGHRYRIIDEYLDKSDAIVARDDWKQHLRKKDDKVMVKIEPFKDGNGAVVWQVLAWRNK